MANNPQPSYKPTSIKHLLIVTCGDPKHGDEAFGSLVADALVDRIASMGGNGSEVRLLDLSRHPQQTLLDQLIDCAGLLLVDVVTCPSRPQDQLVDVDFGHPEQPQFVCESAMSQHTQMLHAQLEEARAQGNLPPRVRMIAVCIHPPAMGEPPSRRVTDMTPQAVQRIEHYVRRWSEPPPA